MSLAADESRTPTRKRAWPCWAEMTRGRRSESRLGGPAGAVGAVGGCRARWARSAGRRRCAASPASAVAAATAAAVTRRSTRETLAAARRRAGAGGPARGRPAGVECAPTMAAPLAPVEVIERSRRGEPVDAESVESFVRSWLDGTADDALMAAWCMVACLRGLPARAGRGPDPRPDRLGRPARARPRSARPATSARPAGWGTRTAIVAAPLAAALGVRVAAMSDARPGPHRRHRRQARGDPRLRRPSCRSGRFVRQVRDVGIAVGVPDGPPRARRPAPLRAARRHRHRPGRRADRGLDHEQEDRRRRRRRRAGRPGRRRRVLRRRGRGPRGGRADGGRSPSPGAAPCAGRSAPWTSPLGRCVGQRPRGARGRRGAARRRPARPARLAVRLRRGARRGGGGR